MDIKKLQWHPGFYAALQIELEDEADSLMFQNEYQLSEKPLGIDVLVVKVNKGIRIRKNIGRIFREHNIIEYKSPEDYISINDYYKVIAYTCIYQSNTEKVGEIKPEELTVTLVCSHFPRKLMRHLEQVQDMKAEEVFRGGYYLSGGMFPVQILVTEQLSKEENFWLGRMRTDLEIENDLDPISKAFKKRRKDPRYEAVADLLFRANYQKAEEARYMCEAIRELFADEYEAALLKGEAQGETVGKLAEAERYSRLILALKEHGKLEDIVKAAEDYEYLQTLYKEYGILD